MAEKTPEKAPGAFSLLGTASTMGLHMVSGPIVGGGLGWLIDHWLGSWPVVSAVGLVLGLAAGFRNVWADARYLERSNAALDEERRKKQEEAEKALQDSPKTVENGASRVFVPVFHKGSECKTGPVLAVEDPGAASDEEREREDFTAAVLAGTAAPEEQELEELDETVEAIRRVLAGEDSPKTPEKRPENGKNGVV
ncbi:AtpZ/AtpI family protein [Mailhella sp.]|uniref:AtpZ/AtpI family protein n=1 Tax=Mailhella sp. TaxID=1981029 RepID=UPI0040649784